jgi:hypothetical protein
MAEKGLVFWEKVDYSESRVDGRGRHGEPFDPSGRRIDFSNRHPGSITRNRFSRETQCKQKNGRFPPEK